MLRIDNNLCIIDKNKISNSDVLEKTTVLYRDYKVCEYTDYSGLRSKELYIYFSCRADLDGQLIVQDHPVFLSLSSDKGKLRVPLVNAVMKHFFRDFENYYYLKDEDTAIHSSLAEFISSSMKKRATVSTAYVKKEGVFLPQYKEEITPSFKTSLKSRLNYFEFSEAFLSSEKQMQIYLTGLLSGLLQKTGRLPEA